MARTELHLSRRERQIMDIVYRLERATAAEVREAMADPPSYSAVRALLRVLEDKGHLRHERQGPRYVFRPTVTRAAARRSALKRVVQTFFDGSAEQAMTALLEQGSLSDDELETLSTLIERARREGR